MLSFARSHLHACSTLTINKLSSIMSLHVVIVFTATLIHYATATVYSDHITGPGTMLYRGDRIESTSKNSRLSMQQTDGNLVLYNATNGPPFVAIWSTHTINATYTEITNDGNITVKDDNGRIYWSSNSGGHNASEYYLVVMDFCAYLMDPYYTVLWSTCEDACNVIYPTFEPPTSNGDTLVPTTQPTHCNCSDTAFDPKPTPLYMDHASTSANHSFFLYPLDRISSRSLNTYATLQTDGNFVLYVDQGCRHKAIWSTNTQNKDAKYVVLMRNGNLKVMGKDGTVLFKSDTYGGYSRPQPQHLVVTDECMYLMDGDYTMYWHQGSGCAVFNGTFPTFSAPTAEPSPTKQPTTIQPTLSPTVYPTITPTLPTSEPTKITIFPTIFPTQIPTTIPTKVPTKSTSDPTKIPTNAPITAKPTDITTFPTVFQTQNPTKTPTKVPIKLTADPTNTLTNAPITDDPTMFVIISSTYKATESDQEEDDTVTKNGSNIWVLVVVFLLSMVTMFALLFGLMRFVMYRSQKQKTQARNEPQNMTHTQMRHFSQDNQANVAVNVQKMSSMSVESCHIATGMDTGNVAEDSVESEGGQLTAEGPEVDLEAMEVEEHQTQGNDNVQEDEFIVV
eukprot:1056376_1